MTMASRRFLILLTNLSVELLVRVRMLGLKNEVRLGLDASRAHSSAMPLIMLMGCMIFCASKHSGCGRPATLYSMNEM